MRNLELGGYESTELSDSSVSRGRERLKRIGLSAAASALAKIISVSTSLISVPLTLRYLGKDEYGMWMTISSFSTLLSFADFGLGNGLVSAVAQKLGEGDIIGIRRIVSNALFVLTIISLILFVVFWSVFPLIDWPKLFGVRGDNGISQASSSVLSFFLCFCVGIPASVVQRLQFGLQRSFLASAWQCGGSATSLFFVLMAVHLKMGTPVLIAALLIGPILSNLFNSVIFYNKRGGELCPRMADIDILVIKNLMKIGLLYFVLQLVTSAMTNSDNIIIAIKLGSAEVANYSIPEKLFSLITVALSMMLLPLWPAYGEAIARRDAQWVRLVMVRVIVASIALASVLAVGMALSVRQIISIWTGHSFKVPFILIVGLGLWKVLEAAGNSLSVFLNGVGVVRIQVIIALITGVAALFLKLALIPMMGIAGAVWATVIAFSAFCLLPYAVIIPRLMRRLQV